VILVTVSACTGPAVKTPVHAVGELSQGVVDPYLSADAALAADRFEGVKANATDISSAARSLGPSALAIDAAAVQLASAGDIDDARIKFGALSEAIDAYMADQHLAPPAGVRVAFCPMAMRPWLQRDGALRNPYYGSHMLTCGSFRN
jgi:hypothetical protein